MSSAFHLPPIVAVPELSFAELRERLEAVHWVLGAESQEPPLVVGEPHWCEFWRRDRALRVDYTFNPVMRLRALALAGDGAVDARAEIAAAVPHLDVPRLRALLHGDDERGLLLGLLAAGELHEVAVLSEVRALEEHANPRVAAAAAAARQAVLPAPVEAALDGITAAKRAHPERSVLFAHYGGPEQRRQILRWLIRDFEASSPSIDEVLRSALADPDPEVRISAVVAAARLEATEVVREVAEAKLPETSAEGADPRERRLYVRLREGALRYLGARAARTLTDTPREKWPPLLQALSGPVPVVDDMTLLIHALTTPVERGEPPATSQGVVADGLRWRLERSGLPLAAVAPVPHWIGHAGRGGAAHDTVANALRHATPTRGLFIAVAPLTQAFATNAADRDAPVLLATREEADRVLERLSATEGVALRLPSADEWEMAMRGPDGRLFPWGNNLAATTRGRESPWQVSPAHTREWTADLDAQEPVVVGDDRVQPASLRRRAAPGSCAAVRLVVEPASP